MKNRYRQVLKLPGASLLGLAFAPTQAEMPTGCNRVLPG